MTYGIWCVVFGGVTGLRQSWLKQAGEVFETQSRVYAERVADELNQQMNRGNGRAIATFRYNVKPHDVMKVG